MASGLNTRSIILLTEAVDTRLIEWAALSRNFSFNWSVDNGLSGEPEGGSSSTDADSPPAHTTLISAHPFGASSRRSALTREAAANTEGSSKDVIWSMPTRPNASAEPIRYGTLN